MEIVFFWFCLWLQWIILFLLMMLFSTWCLLAFNNEQRFTFFSIYSYPFSLDVAKLVVLGGKLPMVTCVFFYSGKHFYPLYVCVDAHKHVWKHSVMMKMIWFLHWLLWNISECKRDGEEKINNIENERIAKNGIGFKGYFIIRGRMRYKRSRSYVCMCSARDVLSSVRVFFSAAYST